MKGHYVYYYIITTVENLKLLFEIVIVINLSCIYSVLLKCNIL